MSELPSVNICFHGIGSAGRQLEVGESRYWISVPQFYSILDELCQWPAVNISFDDGNASDTVIALPALRQRSMTASFFVLAGRFGSIGSIDEDDVGELRSAGMKIGTHGMDHRPWRKLDGPTRQRELVEARGRIAEAAGVPVDQAALPLGRYDRKVLTDLRTLGYARVYTSDRRLARPNAWLQPRFSVRAEDTAEGLRSQVLATRSLLPRTKLETIALVKRFR